MLLTTPGPHTILARAADAAGNFSPTLIAETSLRDRALPAAVQVSVSSSPIAGLAGRAAGQVRVTLTNPSAAPVTVATNILLHASAKPRLRAGDPVLAGGDRRNLRLSLAPGETRVLTYSVTVPDSVPHGTRHLVAVVGDRVHVVPRAIHVDESFVDVRASLVNLKTTAAGVTGVIRLANLGSIPASRAKVLLSANYTHATTGTSTLITQTVRTPRHPLAAGATTDIPFWLPHPANSPVRYEFSATAEPATGAWTGETGKRTRNNIANTTVRRPLFDLTAAVTRVTADQFNFGDVTIGYDLRIRNTGNADFVGQLVIAPALFRDTEWQGAANMLWQQLTIPAGSFVNLRGLSAEIPSRRVIDGTATYHLSVFVGSDDEHVSLENNNRANSTPFLIPLVP